MNKYRIKYRSVKFAHEARVFVIAENEFDDLSKSPIINAMNSGENIIVTPHVGGMTIEGQTKAYEWSINKL